VPVRLWVALPAPRITTHRPARLDLELERIAGPRTGHLAFQDRVSGRRVWAKLDTRSPREPERQPDQLWEEIDALAAQVGRDELAVWVSRGPAHPTLRAHAARRGVVVVERGRLVRAWAAWVQWARHLGAGLRHANGAVAGFAAVRGVSEVAIGATALVQAAPELAAGRLPHGDQSGRRRRSPLERGQALTLLGVGVARTARGAAVALHQMEPSAARSIAVLDALGTVAGPLGWAYLAAGNALLLADWRAGRIDRDHYANQQGRLAGRLLGALGGGWVGLLAGATLGSLGGPLSAGASATGGAFLGAVAGSVGGLHTGGWLGRRLVGSSPAFAAVLRDPIRGADDEPAVAGPEMVTPTEPDSGRRHRRAPPTPPGTPG
jgi:hypothetical protein